MNKSSSSLSQSALNNIRREYGEIGLIESDLPGSPFILFKQWLEEVLSLNSLDDPTAMVLSTVDASGLPDSRVVLLKALDEDGFVFYTNYESQKAKQLTLHPAAALNFYWSILSRQIRIRGQVTKLEPELSQSYFASRPKESQVSALISPQSQVISGRQQLEEQFTLLSETAHYTTLTCPSFWGGYRLIPMNIEFWQGRNNRLHDRIVYTRSSTSANWSTQRLAP